MDIKYVLLLCCIFRQFAVHCTIFSGEKDSIISRLKPKHVRNSEPSLINTKEKSKDPSLCCKNGGQCILNSFCLCPKHFYGRYCEYKIHFRNCRHVPHGYWIKSDCNLCRCHDGDIVCVPHMFDGCDPVLTSEDMKKKIDPFQGKDIDISGPMESEQNDKDYLYQNEQPRYNVEDYYYVDHADRIPSAATSFKTSHPVLSLSLHIILMTSFLRYVFSK